MQQLTHELPYTLDRSVLIKAVPETVFRFFTDSTRWANWWGAGSTIDPKPGGRVYIRHANGIESLGEVLDVCAPERIAFTYGFVSGTPFGPGFSRVTIELHADGAGTRLHLRHEFPDAATRDEHQQGWRFQLSLFGNVVANEVYADVAASVDTWFSAWTIAGDDARSDTLAKIADPRVCFSDRFSLLDGLPDVVAHIGASQRFMPGLRLQRSGDIRQCQGTVLADWIALDVDGNERMSGTNVFAFAPDQKIVAVTGFAV
jgi:uncharacterized protein YndB with AHSA1/START domain